MPNEFVISNGFISKDSSRINGTLTATTITASTITGATIFSSGNTIVGGQFVSLGGTSVTNPTYRFAFAGSNLSPRATFGVELANANLHRYSFDPVNQRGLVFTVANNGSVYIERASIVGIGILGAPGSETGALVFRTLNGSNNSERMRIDNLGNVGIGTDSPAEKLDIVGKTKTTNIQITSGATNGYVLTSDSSGNGTWQQSPLLSGGTINGNLTITGTTTSGTISATTYQNLPLDVFVTGGTYSNNIVTFTNNTGGTFNVTGISQTAFYEQSVWTSFQTPSRNVSSTNFGSGGALATPFMINKEVTILNSRLECTAIATNPTNCEFAIYDVISGVVTNRLFHQVFQVTGTGLYTFPTNLTLQPGIYAWATTQDIILGWRSFTLPENVLGVEPTMGANVFISGKSKTSNSLPNPFGTQANYTSNLPLAIFEITT